MRNFQKRDIKISFLFMFFVLIFCTGCATSFSTRRADEPALKTRYYTASYNKAINAVVEAASKTKSWHIQDVDESQGLIIVVESYKSYFKDDYVVRIFVKKLTPRQVGVDVVSHASYGTLIATKNKKSISKFLEKLDMLLE